MSVWVGVAILVPVVGALLYAFFLADEKRAAKGSRITAFGEAPAESLDEEFDRLGKFA